MFLRILYGVICPYRVSSSNAAKFIICFFDNFPSKFKKSVQLCIKDFKLMTVPAIHVYETISSIKCKNVKRNTNFHEYDTRNKNCRHVGLYGMD
jgi:hypothetical protein